eukprot:scaffold9295_cov122-Isochrysis_galbana.AAC.3
MKGSALGGHASDRGGTRKSEHAPRGAHTAKLNIVINQPVKQPELFNRVVEEGLTIDSSTR